MHAHTHTHRVEGQGAAVITDVIYSSKTEPEAGKGGASSSGSKEEYEGLRAEIREREGELKRLRFKDEVLGRQRMLLVQFASHISKGSSGKVCAEMSPGKHKVASLAFFAVSLWQRSLHPQNRYVSILLRLLCQHFLPRFVKLLC